MEAVAGRDEKRIEVWALGFWDGTKSSTTTTTRARESMVEENSFCSIYRPPPVAR